jgi:UDP-GlcNAc:undecaprenyl-phosphate GlcNAc-1-phosphate transferase
LNFDFNSVSVTFPVWMIISGAVLTAFLITYFSIPTIVKVSKFKELFALPNSRTSHSDPTPNLGGIAIFTGFTISAVIFSHNTESSILRYLLCGMIILLFIGLKDDILILDPKKKILGQIVASLIIVILGDIRITDFHNVLNINEIPYWLSILFTVLLFVFIIISFNFIDGIDGLASGIGLIVLIFYGIWFLLTGHLTYSILCISLTGSLMAFLRFNVFSKTYKIFMGDAGAMVTGLLIAVFSVQFLEFERDALPKFQLNAAPALSIALLFIPLMDAIRIIILRIRDGNLFKSGRNHIHHIMLNVCGSHIISASILISFNLILILVTIIFQRFGNIPLILLMIFLTSIFYIIIIHLSRKRNLKNTETIQHKDHH